MEYFGEGNGKMEGAERRGGRKGEGEVAPSPKQAR